MSLYYIAFCILNLFFINSVVGPSKEEEDDTDMCAIIMAETPFKKVFRYNDELVISLLNSIFEYNDTNKITKVQFLEPNVFVRIRRFSLVDVLCKHADGTRRVVQMSPIGYDVPHIKIYFKELVPFIYYYAIHAYIEPNEPKNMKEVIFVAFLQDNLYDKGEIQEYKRFNIKSKDVRELLGKSDFTENPVFEESELANKFSFTFIEVSKFFKPKLETVEDRWMYVFNFPDENSTSILKGISQMKPTKIFSQVSKALNMSNWPKIDRMEHLESFSDEILVKPHIKSHYTDTLINRFRYRLTKY